MSNVKDNYFHNIIYDLLLIKKNIYIYIYYLRLAKVTGCDWSNATFTWAHY